MAGSADVLKLLSHVCQVPLGLLPVHLGLGEQRVQLGNLTIGRFEFTFFVDEVFAQFVDLVILAAAILQIAVQLLGLERVVFFEPRLFFL